MEYLQSRGLKWAAAALFFCAGLVHAQPGGASLPPIRLAMVESDGTASDVLMSVAGGAAEIQSFVDQIGVTGMKVVNTEKEIGRDWQTQYDNWSTPMASVELLRYLAAVPSRASPS